MLKSKMCIDAQKLSGFTRSPGLLRVTPIYPFEQVAKLCRGDADAVARRQRPHEAAPVQPLRIQRQSEPVVPQAFQEIASTPAKDVKIAREGIAPEPLLDKKRQPVHAAAHVGVAGRDPHPNAGRDGDHRRSSTSRTRASASASTAPSTTTRRPRPTSITMRPWAACRGVLRRGVGSPLAAGSGVSTAGTKAGAGLAATTLDLQRSAPCQKLEAGDPVPPSRRRHQPGRRQAFHHDAELLVLRPPASATQLDNLKTPGGDTVLIAVHKHSVDRAPTASQGGPRRRRTFRPAQPHLRPVPRHYSLQAGALRLQAACHWCSPSSASSGGSITFAA